jgi:hypothetical protein
LLAACAVAGAGESRAQARDSAGIRIIDSAQPLWTSATALRLSSAPAVVIGNRDGEAYELARVSGAVRLTDGTIVVADGATSQLRFFDATGRHLRSIGGRGGGPGEFNELGLITKLTGDTIAAGHDFGPVSFFTGDGRFIRQAARILPSTAGTRGFINLNQAILDDQTIAIATLPRPQPRADGTRWVDSMPVTLLDRTGTRVVSLGTQPYGLWAMHKGQPYPVRFTDPLSVTTNGREIFIGYGSHYLIRVYSPAGRLVRIIRRPWTPTRVTSAEIDRYADAWGKRWITATGAEYDRELREFRQVPFAETVSAISQLIADRTGRLWVRESRIADASAPGALGLMPLVPSVWNVFDDGGRWLGNVTMPARFLVHEIGADYVLGLARDTDGVETVAMYRLEGGAR